jgi:hypothetical protein
MRKRLGCIPQVKTDDLTVITTICKSMFIKSFLCLVFLTLSSFRMDRSGEKDRGRRVLEPGQVNCAAKDWSTSKNETDDDATMSCAGDSLVLDWCQRNHHRRCPGCRKYLMVESNATRIMGRYGFVNGRQGHNPEMPICGIAAL